MTPTMITPGLVMLPGFVNMYLLAAPDGLTLIDTGLPGGERTLLDGLARLGREPGEVRHVVLTHAHPDHIGGAAAIVRATGARTYMHALDAPIAERGAGFRPVTKGGFLPGVLIKSLSMRGTKVGPVRIDERLADGDLLPVAGGLRVVHAPGHCAGQVALLWPSRGVLFAADVCAHLLGLGPPIGYEDRDEGRASQRKLAGLDFEVACFGHGRPIRRGASARFREHFGMPLVGARW